MPPALTALDHERFCTEYLKDLNATQAAIRAGISKRTAMTLMGTEAIQARIAELTVERNARVSVEADTVLREVLAIATCDTNEIVEIRRGCCRHCYGSEHRYQYVDQRELRRGETDYLTTNESLVEPFEHGGIGFDPKREPHADCPQCGGEGSAYVHIKDTRHLSPAARALFAGAKQTKDGIEVKLHAKDKHLELLMRHLGLLNDKMDLNVKGDLIERLLAGRKRAGG